ncbi:taste receptor type 2 member 7-like [Colius striatus]|uniref:taste receptor type 2 member 7-like n=1 Tax=Colius striatus TaxID=57412 RepID=UPI002B1D2A7F|nr:taste receptor type 2 member 7-like [Colius striatus]
MEICYSPDKFNATSFHVMTMTIITLQAFSGMWINAFIVSVLCIAWVKKRTFNSNEKILLFLGCSRFMHICITWLYYFIAIIHPCSMCIHPTAQLFSSFQSFFNSSNLWVSACLCLFYCIKIANFRHVFFIYLKVKIDRIMPWLLLSSVLLSLVFSTLIYDIIDKVQCKNLNSTTAGNILTLRVKMDEHLFPVLFFSGFLFATAFMVVIFSASLLLYSLWTHNRKMQTNSVKDLSTDAHIKAMKSILSFFFIYTINFVCLVLTLIYSTKKENPVAFLALVYPYFFSTVHSLILIFSNPKMEKTLLKTLLCGKYKACMR